MARRLVTVLQTGRGRRTPKITVCARACTLVQDARRCSRCTPTSLCSPVTFAEAAFSLSTAAAASPPSPSPSCPSSTRRASIPARSFPRRWIDGADFDLATIRRDTPVTDLPPPRCPIMLHRRGGGPRFLRSLESRRTVWLRGKRAFRCATERSLNPTEALFGRSFSGTARSARPMIGFAFRPISPGDLRIARRDAFGPNFNSAARIADSCDSISRSAIITLGEASLGNLGRLDASSHMRGETSLT